MQILIKKILVTVAIGIIVGMTLFVLGIFKVILDKVGILSAYSDTVLSILTAIVISFSVWFIGNYVKLSIKFKKVIINLDIVLVIILGLTIFMMVRLLFFSPNLLKLMERMLSL